MSADPPVPSASDAEVALPARLKVLMLEDEEEDAKLILRALQRGGIELSAQRVETREAFLLALHQQPPDVILADYKLPAFDGPSALHLARELLPGAPVIIVTGALPDDAAVELLREGAADYILKDRLSRLAPAVRRAIAEAELKKAAQAADRALRSSELRYRTLFESARDGILILDSASGVIVDANPPMGELIGCSRDELIGAQVAQLDAFQAVEATGAAFRAFEHSDYARHDHLVLGTGNGKSDEFEVIGNAFAVEGRRFVQCTIRDLSVGRREELIQLKHRVAELNRMAEEIGHANFGARLSVAGTDDLDTLGVSLNVMAAHLADLDVAKDDFVALASHQLRTPATAVKGNLGMLLEGYCGELTSEQREVLADAFEANQRQLALIEDLLTVSRIDIGKMVLSGTVADLRTLVRSVTAEQRQSVEARQQTLQVAVPDTPVSIWFDAPRLRMAFENLISNACKYTPMGGIIEVTLKWLDGQARFAVRDTGVGILPQDLGKLFRKFSRLDNPLSLVTGGTGLGLYVANGVVLLHQGRIEVASEPGRGSTFTIVLPPRSQP